MAPKIKHFTKTEEFAKEPCVFMSNHANDYGPVAVRCVPDKKFWTWTAASMLSLRHAPKQIMKTIFPNARGILFVICRILSVIMAFFMVPVFRLARGIPVYRDARLKITYEKTFEKLKKGHDVVIFPECIVPNPENPYLDVLQKGAFRLFTLCKAYDLPCPPVYPVYCCKALNKVVAGKRIDFDGENSNSREAEAKLMNEVGDEIKRLAETLPPHKITHYAEIPKDIERIRKYFLPGEDKIYERLRDVMQEKGNE